MWKHLCYSKYLLILTEVLIIVYLILPKALAENIRFLIQFDTLFCVERKTNSSLKHIMYINLMSGEELLVNIFTLRIWLNLRDRTTAHTFYHWRGNCLPSSRTIS